MVFLAEEAVGFLNLPIRGRPVDFQKFVEIFDAEDQREEKAEDESRREQHRWKLDADGASWADDGGGERRQQDINVFLSLWPHDCVRKSS